jgi:positive regulator of sigma E activity
MIFGVNWLFKLYVLYFVIAFIMALITTKNLIVAFMAVWAIVVQFMGYGLGFLESTWAVEILKKKPEKRFPELFF